jgi:hypothetical protein
MRFPVCVGVWTSLCVNIYQRIIFLKYETKFSESLHDFVW